MRIIRYHTLFKGIDLLIGVSPEWHEVKHFKRGQVLHFNIY